MYNNCIMRDKYRRTVWEKSLVIYKKQFLKTICVEAAGL